MFLFFFLVIYMTTSYDKLKHEGTSGVKQGFRWPGQRLFSNEGYPRGCSLASGDTTHGIQKRRHGIRRDDRCIVDYATFDQDSFRAGGDTGLNISRSVSPTVHEAGRSTLHSLAA